MRYRTAILNQQETNVTNRNKERRESSKCIEVNKGGRISFRRIHGLEAIISA